MNLPENIRKLTAGRDFVVNNVGRSGSKVLCFDDMVLKIEQRSVQTDNEAAALKWLEGKLPVPKLLMHEHSENTSFLLMSCIKGSMLCDAEILASPKKLVSHLAEALDMLWCVKIEAAPLLMTLDDKLKIAGERVAAGICSVKDAEPETYSLKGFASPEKLLQWLIDNRPKEELVLSHGDFCLPNIFINSDKVNGFIDLGRCGISDKYQDIALCWRSLCHNYDGRFGKPAVDDFDPDILFTALGIVPDKDMIRYYILLDELF